MTERLHANRTQWFPLSAWWVGLHGGGLEDNSLQNAAPLRTLRAPSAHSHLLRGPAYVIQLPQNLIFRTSPGKKDPHIRVFSAFPGAGWGKQGGEKASILEPLAAIGRGRNLPYFGKWGN